MAVRTVGVNRSSVNVLVPPWPVDNALFEEVVLLRIDGAARNAPIAEISAVGSAGVKLTKAVGGLATAGWKAIAPPDLVEPAAVAAIAVEQIFLPHAQPAGDPNVDGIGFREWARGELGRVALVRRLVRRLAIVAHACLTLGLN